MTEGKKVRSYDELTAFPLKGERLRLKRIDQVLLEKLSYYAFNEIVDNPEHELNKQIHEILYVDAKKFSDTKPIADLKKALTVWMDDFGSRLSQDKINAGMKGIDEFEEVNELNKMIEHERDHIRIVHDEDGDARLEYKD